MGTALVWFRQDLRLVDNPAFYHAYRSHERVIPFFIDDPHPQSINRLGEASRVWLHHSLASLAESLQQQYGLSLQIYQGDPLALVPKLVESEAVSQVYWNRCYDPYSVDRDTRLKQQLQEKDGHQCQVKSYKSAMLYEPWQILKADNAPYRVFTPYWKMVQKTGLGEAPLPAPQRHLASSEKTAETVNSEGALTALTREDLKLVSPRDWPTTMMENWQVGETAALDRLEVFLEESVGGYSKQRDFPALPATSRLSPYLHFGEISPRMLVYRALSALDQNPAAEQGIMTFIKEVVWREFAYQLLYHYPQTLSEPLNEKFAGFPWLSGQEEVLVAWQKGRTGIPIIDAGMRELWQTGWMHNRVRMIVASFLTKNLLIPWQQGEAWFRDTLVDADLANNALGWQWVAGSGADAAPYFRIFNPVLQSRKFDPQGVYLRRWVPELSAFNDKQIHKPDQPPVGYPEPVIDLKFSRERALEAYQTIR